MWRNSTFARASRRSSLRAVEHVVELYRLTHDARIGRHSRDAWRWIGCGRIPGFRSYVETELVSCAVESAANDALARHFDYCRENRKRPRS